MAQAPLLALSRRSIAWLFPYAFAPLGLPLDPVLIRFLRPHTCAYYRAFPYPQ
ncbi:uncharacterized protein CC84DRAFT_1167621 [Paraphaeosphaeria sporulosa]|uniref:Uncharacterized protein n=1 Tax=Paraphaeosphaeria sporulosa TaxID=1460663 RepID=A0A177C1U0_9PLEO|nr:uncharacterized protein CC84DRAFT_1167621 [Paraphaeosphaeria sporulosa]OAG01416.1 hypothetical protein CC84DRAFT_1167621 [Paraphaeosphaeria sporulosa]